MLKFVTTHSQVPQCVYCSFFSQHSHAYRSARATGQAVAGATRWLESHWRAAKVICLDFRGYPEACDWDAGRSPPSSPAGSARVLRVTCRRLGARIDILPVWGQTEEELPLGLPRWVAGVMPLCRNLTALHLRCVELREVPALPLLVHLILEHCVFQPALVASLQGLARLETLHARGAWGLGPPAWDVRACTRLRRMFMSRKLVATLAEAGQELRVPPACAVALELPHEDKARWWLERLGGRLADLRLSDVAVGAAATHATFVHMPQLSQLRHGTLYLALEPPHSLCVARLLCGLPRSVETLYLKYRVLLSEQAVVVVPASLRALRIKAVCDMECCSPILRECICPPSECTRALTFGLHGGLHRLCLVLWHARVGLQCLDASAPASLRELNVQGKVVDMDAPLAAEVARRGRRLACCDVVDGRWGEGSALKSIIYCAVRMTGGKAGGRHVLRLQVVHIGQGPVHMEFIIDGDLPRFKWGCDMHWPCTCGSCAECLRPEAFGGVVDAWRYASALHMHT